MLLDLDVRGQAPGSIIIREMANILHANRDQRPPSTVGINWLTTSLKQPASYVRPKQDTMTHKEQRTRILLRE